MREKLNAMGVEQFQTIAGTSVGALNAVLIANGDVAAAERIWTEKDVVKFGAGLLFGWYVLAYVSLLGPLAVAPFLFLAGFLGAWGHDWRPANLIGISFVLGAISLVTGFAIRFKMERVFFVIENETLMVLAKMYCSEDSLERSSPSATARTSAFARGPTPSVRR